MQPHDTIEALLKRMISSRTPRSTIVTYSLLTLLILFCAAVGFGLAGNHANAGALVVFTIAAMIALQLAYIATLIFEALHDHH